MKKKKKKKSSYLPYLFYSKHIFHLVLLIYTECTCTLVILEKKKRRKHPEILHDGPNGPRHAKTCHQAYADSVGPDQPELRAI